MNRILTFILLLSLTSHAAVFQVTHPDKALPEIVYPDIEEFDLDKLEKTSQIQDRYEQQDTTWEAVRYLREGIERMTGHRLDVVSREDKSRGIVLLLFSDAPEEIRADAKIQEALRTTGEDIYNANEAFYIRTEAERVLIVVNTIEGFNHAAAALLDSVGYEILGMGPNWIHIPDFKNKPLVFDLEMSDRPKLYVRDLGLSSGQGHGLGTLFNRELPDPADETVDVSYNRWTIGARTIGKSLPRLPGHSMQKYHAAVVEKMTALKTDEGFMGSVGVEMYHEGGKYFVKNGTHSRSLKLDLSVPFVREIVLEDFKKRSEEHFANQEKGEHLLQAQFIFGTDPEDGIMPEDVTHIRYPDWYPAYLKAEKVPFGKPYALHGLYDLDQPRETWDGSSFSDTVFAFNNWLLREYDKWIDSLPPEQRVTIDGVAKKQMVRLGLLSYNCHDVPPNFNLDPRIRLKVAGYPKHRGYGKWQRFSSHAHIATAFHVLLPEEPIANYWIKSISYYRDFDTSGIRGSSLPETIQKQVRGDYDAGFRAIFVETDLNYGKLGLEYYLTAKMFWNPLLTARELDALRDRWLQRAFGNGWQEMKAYYDFMAPENYVVNAPNSWARAIHLIESADAKIDAKQEPAAQRRVDDVKQFWYFYYLRESGKATADSGEMKEFLWKGQMSYMTAMHMAAKRIFDKLRVNDVVPKELQEGPAHYSHEETAAWWKQMLDFWPLTAVSDFSEMTLANGKKGRDVRQNDLVAVQEFQTGEGFTAFRYHSATWKNAAFLSIAREKDTVLGFNLSWPFQADNNNYREKNLFYGISRWDEANKEWHELVDITMVSAPSKLIDDKDGKPHQLVEVRYKAPQPGTYRINLGFGGDGATLEPVPNESVNTGFTFFETLSGLGRTPVYIYIPKGAKNLDLETWGNDSQKSIILHRGLPANGMQMSRTVDISKIGTHVIRLKEGEDGSFAVFDTNAFRFPFLYSVPLLWATSTGQLLVPRDIAEADVLTIVE